jgi:hypothetical protein
MTTTTGGGGGGDHAEEDTVDGKYREVLSPEHGPAHT